MSFANRKSDKSFVKYTSSQNFECTTQNVDYRRVLLRVDRLFFFSGKFEVNNELLELPKPLAGTVGADDVRGLVLKPNDGVVVFAA